MENNSWSSVFADVNQACDGLAGHVLEMVNDLGLLRTVDQVTMNRLRHSARNDAYSACYDFLLVKGAPHESLRDAMIRFCRLHWDLHCLLHPHLLGEGVVTVVSARPDLELRLRPPIPPSSTNSSSHPSGSQASVHPSSPNPLLRRVAKTAGPAFRKLQDANGGRLSLPSSRVRALTDTDYHLPCRGPCLGRDAEIKKLLSALCQPLPGAAQPAPRDSASPPTCCILGPPAIGKTTLASIVISHGEFKRKYGSRRFWVSAEACSCVQDLRDNVAEALPVGPRSSWADCLSYLFRAPALIALDNIDTLWNKDELRGDTEVCLQELSQYSSTLVTMRGTMPPTLLRPWDSKIQLKKLGPEDAVSVFLLYAPEFKDDPGLTALLCDCDGLPLAVSLLSRAADSTRPLSHLRRAWDEKRTDLLRRGNFKEVNLPISLDLAFDQPSIREDSNTWSILRLLASHVSEDDCGRLLRDDGLASAFDVLAVAGLVVWENDAFRLLEPVRAYLAHEFACPSQAFLREWLQFRVPIHPYCERQFPSEFQEASPVEGVTRIQISRRRHVTPSISLTGPAAFSRDMGYVEGTTIDEETANRVLSTADGSWDFKHDSLLSYRKRRLTTEQRRSLEGPFTRLLLQPRTTQFRCLVLHNGDYSVHVSCRPEDVAETRDHLAKNGVRERGGYTDDRSWWTQAWDRARGTDSRTFDYP